MVLAADMIKTRWLLRGFMAQHRIKNKELADVMGKHPVTIARLKSGDEIPPVGGSTLDDLCDALTRLLRSRGEEKIVKLVDLIEFYENNEPA